MPCKKYHPHSQGWFESHTWSGNKVGSICDIDDIASVKHYVEVKLLKTYDVFVYVKGTIVANNAKFDGHRTVTSETEWIDDKYLGPSYGLYDYSFNKVQIKKKSVGGDIIAVTVDFSDAWIPGQRNSADEGSLVFEISVV